MTAGTALRELQRAQAGLRKARLVLRGVRGRKVSDDARLAAFRAGWEHLCESHKILGTIPHEAASEEVLTRQLAVERYSTALLVRLRRLARNEPDAEEADDDLDA